MNAHRADAELQRARFHQPDDSPAQAAVARQVLPLLLTQDGSATRLCETVAGGPVELHLLAQRVVQDVPTEVRTALPGAAFLERWTCLAAHGEVMMDNLSYTVLDGLPDDVRHDLERGHAPIGHLLQRLWVRRWFLDDAPAVYQRLWATVGLPDPGATRAYGIATPEGPCMLIAETFRRGMLLGLGSRGG